MYYSALIEEIQNLPTDEKIEVRYMLDKLIIQDRRSDIENEYKASLKRAKQGKLTFTSDINKLMDSLKA